MYSLLIVDDESMIRDGLTNIVDWNSLGYCIKASLEDGRDAIEYIKHHKVDVILSDIKMVHLSGLDIAEHICKHKLDIKVVILSGFKEFELAQTAIKYGVHHYLLKPTDFDELISVFSNLKVDLDKKGESQRLRENQEEELRKLLEEQFYIDLTVGGLISEDKVLQRIKLIGLSENLVKYQCSSIIFRVEDYNSFLNNVWKHGKESLSRAFTNMLSGENEGLKYRLNRQYNNHLYMTVHSVEDIGDDIFDSKVRRVINNLIATTKTLLGVVIIIEQKNSYNNAYELARACRKQIIPMTEPKESMENAISEYDYELLHEQRKLILTYVRDGDIEGIKTLFTGLMDELQLVNISLVKDFIIKLFVGINDQLLSMGISETGRLEAVDYLQVMRIETISEIVSWCEKMWQELEKVIKKKTNDSERHIIRKAKDYIYENYNKDISLKDVSEQIYLNSVYFSRLFKQETGETFTDFLIKVRMDKAMELLNENRYKVYEICELVGYKNIKYFYKIFRKYVGVTPTEYRQGLE